MQSLSISKVIPNPDQPRKVFDGDKLAELAASIKESGLHTPIMVRPLPDGRFMIVYGERRWRAHKLLRRKTITAIVQDMTDDQLADAAIIENLQRADISPLEEARAFQRRLDEGVQLDDLARRLGVTTKRIEFRTSLLKLAPEFIDLFEKGALDRYQANQLARLGVAYQRLLFQAIKDGRCKTRNQLRHVTRSLVEKEQAGLNTSKAFALAVQQDQATTGSLFQHNPKLDASQRATVSKFERKLASVVELLQEGVQDNEIVAVSRCTDAEITTQKLELLEKQLRQIRLAIEASKAINQVTAA